MAPSSASSPRGTRGRGLLLNFLPPRAKLSFLWRTIVNDEIKIQREYPRISYLEYLEVFRSGKCSDWGKKRSKHKRHTCRLDGFSARIPVRDCTHLLWILVLSSTSFVIQLIPFSLLSIVHRHPGGCICTNGG